jgi:hypothetical protein
MRDAKRILRGLNDKNSAGVYIASKVRAHIEERIINGEKRIAIDPPAFDVLLDHLSVLGAEYGYDFVTDEVNWDSPHGSVVIYQAAA